MIIEVEYNAVCKCGSCDWEGDGGALADADDAILTAGDPSPAGRCPECGCLAYVEDDKSWRYDHAEEILGALTNLTADAHKLLLIPGGKDLLPSINAARALLAESKGYSAFSDGGASDEKWIILYPKDAAPEKDGEPRKFETREAALSVAYAHMIGAA